MSQSDFDLAEKVHFQIQQRITDEKPVITLFPFEEYKDIDPDQIDRVLEFLAFQNKIKLKKSFSELNTEPEFRKYSIGIVQQPIRKSLYSHRISNYIKLAKDGDVSHKVITLAKHAFNVMFVKEIPRNKYCKTSINESDDETVLLMQELGMARVDWDYLNEQRHRAVGNRLLEVFINGAEVCLFLDIKLGRKSFINHEALDHISKAVKNTLSFNEWIDFFLSRGISSDFFTTEYQPSKTDLVCSVLSVFASTELQEDMDLVLSLLEHFAHPLFHGGDKEKANVLKNKIANLIDYDDLVFDGGKIVNKNPASPPTEMKYLTSQEITEQVHLPLFDAQQGDILFKNERCHIGRPGDYQYFICEQLLHTSEGYKIGGWVSETDLEYKFTPLAYGFAAPFKNSKWVADAVYKINSKFKKKFDILKFIAYSNANLRIVIENFKATD